MSAYFLLAYSRSICSPLSLTPSNHFCYQFFSLLIHSSNDGNDDKADVAAAFQMCNDTFEDHQCQIVLAVLTEMFSGGFLIHMFYKIK